MIKAVLLYLIVINILTFLLYGIDKLKAKADWWRIKESTLIGMAVIGGAYGALIGMYLFHHKTRKAKFYVTVPMLVLIYTVLLVILMQQMIV